MKSILVALASILATTISAWAASPTSSTIKPVTYSHLRAEVRRLSGLEGGEYVLSNAIALHPVRLNLKPFGRGSDAFYVDKKDMIGFICDRAEHGFKGGIVDAVILRHIAVADEGDFFAIENCAKAK